MYLRTTLLPTILLLLLPNPVASHPTPSPQEPGIPLGLQCPNGPTCQRMMVMSCANGNLYCSLGNMINIPVGKCSDCAGSICAKGSDAYPGDSTPKSTRPSEEEVVVVERVSELVERQTFGSSCQAQWECACVAFDGKGYYTRGKGSQCPVMEGAQESCTEDTGFLVSA
ncbi:hypothetical protein V8F33_008865 [Rhypophila sp. PSN 637]